MPENDAEQQDAIQSLFIRLNSKGTPLSGEELVFSLFKAEFGEFALAWEEQKERFVSPSRFVALLIRLALTRAHQLQNEGKSKSRTPAFPQSLSPAKFRKELDKEEFRMALHYYADPDTGRAKLLFDGLKSLLVMEKDKGDYRLPPVLAAELAQNNPDVLLLLLRWLDLYLGDSFELNISEKTKKQILGFATALAWFADDKNRAVSSLWGKLHDDRSSLKKFFSREHMKACLILKDEGHNFIMLPLPECAFFTRRVQSLMEQRGRINWDTEYGPSQSFSHKLLEMTRHWQGTIVENENNEGETNYAKQRIKLAKAWGRFFDKAWESRDLLLYAQRHFLCKTFKEFDPLLQSDMNRPWDIDHILPYSYGTGHLDTPEHIKDWINCIGNLRAWPLELNRIDQDKLPAVKLSQGHIDAHLDRFTIYDLDSEASVQKASSIAEQPQKEEPWDKITRVKDPKSKFWQNHPDVAGAAPKAIGNRFIRIYQEWFDTLCLEDLF
jgi:hypothetical protein